MLLPIAEKVKGELLLPTGHLAQTLVADLRLERHGIAALVVLYLSDFDPSGHDMPLACSRKLQALKTLRGHPSLEIQVHAVCLTKEQVIDLELPSSPLKEGESRKRCVEDRDGLRTGRAIFHIALERPKECSS